jgi:hypothetical protein
MTTFFEGFDDMLLTIDPVVMVPSRLIDDSPRNVLFSASGGIMSISRNIPERATQFQCPSFIDESATLGKNNFCWSYNF